MNREAHKKRTLPDGLLTLLPKHNLDKTKIKNAGQSYSLTNIWKSLERPSPSNSNPTCQTHTPRSVGRKIQNHLHFIRDIIIFTEEKQNQAAIIGLHEEKGLHNVHDYVFKTITAVPQARICPTTQDRFLHYAKSLKDRDKTDLETPFSLKH